MANQNYDVVVIGAGPAGYVAAIRCAQLGLSTACVDRWPGAQGEPSLGGTCLNVGCIPSKALLDSSHHYHRVRHEAKAHGIEISEARIDVPTMQRRKDKVVNGLTKGVEALFKKNGVVLLHGHGALAGEGRVTVTPAGGNGGDAQLIEADHIVIATGSTPTPLAVAEVDNQRIVDSTGALAFEAVPARLGVIGAGVIGLELGSVWSRLGAQVTILEALDSFLPAVDQEIAREAQKALKKQGLDIRLASKVTAARSEAEQVTVSYQDASGAQTLEVDKLIVAVGRKPCSDGLGAEDAGLTLDNHGLIEVDEQCRTGVDGVFAVGDVVRGAMLAHKGQEEGMAVAERIAGQLGHVDYATIPWVIYTWPEIAWVGQSEQALKEQGIEYRSGVFPLSASGRARAMGETIGKVKILGDARTDRILGVHIFAPEGSELIGEAVTAMAFDASTEDLARTVHAHPTLCEALHEAALAVDARAIHI